jgi:16S rRNA (cytosine1402-N4)-methyltransferase
VADVVDLLAGRQIVVDGTVGAGGHAEALLDAGVGTVVGMDRDPAALEEATVRLARFGDRFRPVLARFSRIGEALRDVGVVPPPVAHRAGGPAAGAVGGILLDLGVSSMQLDRPERGFAFRSSGALDMRMGPAELGRPSAAEVVNTYPEQELARVIYEYGEERMSRRIAAAVVRARSRAPIETTDQLAAIVAGAARAAGRGRRGGPHPARRTFQAIRIEVNGELEELAACLPQAASLLEPHGRVVVLSYHSLEDRIVKRFFAEEPSLDVLTRKPHRASATEASANPRARSARLRAAERREVA